MAKRIQDGKLLYHMTAIDNLESIFVNGLLSRNEALNKKLLIKDVANPDIIKKRQLLNIDNFIPFHFFEKTPFSGTILKSYADIDFCHITVERNFARNSNWLICNSHPLSNEAKIFDYDTGIKNIDWVSAELRDYNNDRSKNACMAECLAQSPIYPNAFFSIFVKNKQLIDYVENLAIKIIGNCPFEVWANEVFF